MSDIGMKIYIAGPYTAPTEEGKKLNTHAAIDSGLIVLAKGHFPFIPHLTHYVDERARDVGVSLSWEDYIRWDLVWLEKCDALLYLGSSRGADLELEAAKSQGKKIFYSVDEIPDLAGRQEMLKGKVQE